MFFYCISCICVLWWRTQLNLYQFGQQWACILLGVDRGGLSSAAHAMALELELTALFQFLSRLHFEVDGVIVLGSRRKPSATCLVTLALWGILCAGNCASGLHVSERYFDFDNFEPNC